MQKFRFGIMGAGNIASNFCDAVKTMDNAVVTAVASKTPGKPERFAAEHNIARYYDNYEDMLKSDDIDAVYIATTHNFHYENAMEAIKFGKHILCEKCFVLNKADAEAVFAAAKEKNLFCMEATWSRFLPAVNKAKEWIESGAIGDINLVNYTIGFKSDENEQGRMRNKSLAGGAMFDIGVYAIEITTYIVNKKLKDVRSTLSYFENGCDKVDTITLSFEDCIANLNAIITCDVPNEMHIYGTKGRIYIKNPHYADSCELYDQKGLKESFFSRRDNGFEFEINEVIRCVENREIESPVIPHSATIECAGIFDKCFEQNPIK